MDKGEEGCPGPTWGGFLVRVCKETGAELPVSHCKDMSEIDLTRYKYVLW